MMGHGFFYATFTTSPGIFFWPQLSKNLLEIYSNHDNMSETTGLFLLKKKINYFRNEILLLPGLGLGYQDHLD